jgi:hypothetical protein
MQVTDLQPDEQLVEPVFDQMGAVAVAQRARRQLARQSSALDGLREALGQLGSGDPAATLIRNSAGCSSRP